MSFSKKFKKKNLFPKRANKKSSGLDEYLQLQAVVGKNAADAITNKNFAQSERESKSYLKPPKDELPEETLKRAFTNFKVVVNNALEWKLFGFNEVPKNFDSLEEKAVRFSMFFCVLDFSIAQSQSVLKALDNKIYDDAVSPYLLEPQENPAHYMADYIERFQREPIGQNPAGDYENLFVKQIFDAGIPLDDFMNMSNKIENFGRKFDRFRKVLISAFMGAKDIGISDFDNDFLNAGILTINSFEHFF